MIDAGIYIDFKANYGYTPLHVSAAHGTVKVADLLIKAQADLNVEDNCEETPLKLARKSGHERIFKELLKQNGKKVIFTQIDDDIECRFRRYNVFEMFE